MLHLKKNTKSVHEWIIKASTKLYDHEKSFSDNGYIDWSQKVYYDIGDIIYVCFVGDKEGIKYKTQVEKINMSFSEITDDYKYWKVKKKYYKDKKGNYARLRLIEALDNCIDIRSLILNDMPIDIPFIQRISSKKLSDYINEVFTKKSEYIKINNPRNIPSNIRKIVWVRDGGCCSACGSKEKLHFDHIIPFSKGGSSTNEENIQILCEKCNLKKSNNIM